MGRPSRQFDFVNQTPAFDGIAGGLRPFLDGAYAAAEVRSEFVITMRRDTKANLRTRFQKVICQAGLTPRPWQ